MSKFTLSCSVLLAGAFLLTAGCLSSGSSSGSGLSWSSKSKRVRVLTPQRFYTSVDWSDVDKQKDVATRSLRITRSASYSFVRVRTAEKPHVHDHTDLVVTVLSGKVMMHLGMQHVEVGPGDVIEVPRGTLHWAENIGKEAAEAFVVATPPYRGDDMRLVDIPK